MNAKSLISVFFCCLTACSPVAHDDHEHEPEQEQVQAPSNRLAIPEHVRRNLGITFVEVQARAVARTIRIPGAFELRPLARHEYRMILPGRVKLLVDQYQQVEKDQPLFRFESPAWAELAHEIIGAEEAIETALAEIEVARAKAEEARKKLELKRTRIEALARADFKRADLEAEAGELAASLPRLASDRQLAETRLRNAKRNREHSLHRASTATGIPEQDLEQEVQVGGRKLPTYQNIDWITVRAFESGVVESLAVTDGAFIEPPTNVLSIVDPRQVRFRAMALQADLSRLTGAVSAAIVPPQFEGTPIDEAVSADIKLSLEAHPRERTLTVLATPEKHAAWIRPGVSAFLEIVVDASDPKTLAIPRSAVVRDGLTHVFFRRDPKDPDTVIRVEADMGVSDGRWVVLNSGVMLGDEVVHAGSYELELAMDQSGASQASGGHVHADGTSHDDH